jgi:tRNA(Ile)-lysidine synthase
VPGLTPGGIFTEKKGRIVSLDQRFADAMGQHLGPDFPMDIGLAVSGGGDSMAMLYLAHNWAHRWGLRLWVCTVNHGLRAEAADEAAMVADECAALGWPHATLRWHWDGTGNKMDAARRGRLEMIDRWRGVLRHVLMAHTRDDLAETFLMRLARGSGVEGLSAMEAVRQVRHSGLRSLDAQEFDGALPQQWERIKGGPGRLGHFAVVRPCLEMSRAELRHYLTVLKGCWVDDPSNDDPSYDRVKMRQALPALAELGLDVATLAATAERMTRARGALQARAVQVWGEIGQEGRSGHATTGEILFVRDGFERTERDTQLRLLAAALQYTASAEYRPRAEPLEALLDRLLGGGGGTLHGCEARMEQGQLRVCREFKAVTETVVPHAAYQLWDGRWRVFASAFRETEGVEIRALGDAGWSQVKDKPEGCPPYHAARSLPALWQGETLLACDALGIGPGAMTRLWPMGREMYGFKAFLMSH